MITKKQLIMLVCYASCKSKVCDNPEECFNIERAIAKAKCMNILEPPRKAWVVKQKAELDKILEAQGYVKGKNRLVHPYRITFVSAMFVFCGQPPSPNFDWDSSWLEEREVDE